MTFENTYIIQNDHRLIIKLPEKFKSKKKVRVIIEDIDETRDEKIKMLKEAMNDPLFLSDIDEAASDFNNSDNDL